MEKYQSEAVQPLAEKKQSTSSLSAESMTDVLTNLLSRGNNGSSSTDDYVRSPTARSPSITRSPTGSKPSSRRESFLFFMGVSTDSGGKLNILFI